MSLIKSNITMAVLCVALAVPTALQLQSEAESFVDVGRIPLMFDGFTADNVGSVQLAQPLDGQPTQPGRAQADTVSYKQLVLALTDAGWALSNRGRPDLPLAGAPAMKSRIEADVFEHLRSIRKDPETLVQPAATEQQLAEYGLDDAHAFVVRCFDRTGKTIVADLLVGQDASKWGKGSGDVRGVFVRQRGSNDVVLYELPKPWRRSVKPKEWVDRALFRLEPDKVRRLAIRNGATGKRTFVFERGPNQMRWESRDAADLGAPRQAEIEGLVQRLRYVAAQSVKKPLSRAGDMQALGLFPPQITLQVTVQDGNDRRQITLEVGSRLPEKNEHFLTCSESKFLLTWPASKVAQFELDVAQRLFDPKPK